MMIFLVILTCMAVFMEFWGTPGVFVLGIDIEMHRIGDPFLLGDAVDVEFTLPDGTTLSQNVILYPDGFLIWGGDMIVGKLSDDEIIQLQKMMEDVPENSNHQSQNTNLLGSNRNSESRQTNTRGGTSSSTSTAKIKLLSTEIESLQWDCPIPYEIDDAPNVDDILEAIDHWEDHTDWRFVERTTEEDYVVFNDGNGCSSWVGKISGPQEVTLSDKCDTGNAIHEIGHVIGFFHEHTRLDRDDFVEILWDYIKEDHTNNFKKNEPSWSNDVGSYDFYSIMHYPLDAFLIEDEDGDTPDDMYTIMPLVPVDEDIEIGQREKLSDGDIFGARHRYEDAGNVVCDVSPATSNISPQTPPTPVPPTPTPPPESPPPETPATPPSVITAATIEEESHEPPPSAPPSPPIPQITEPPSESPTENPTQPPTQPPTDVPTEESPPSPAGVSQQTFSGEEETLSVNPPSGVLCCDVDIVGNHVIEGSYHVVDNTVYGGRTAYINVDDLNDSKYLFYIPKIADSDLGVWAISRQLGDLATMMGISGETIQNSEALCADEIGDTWLISEPEGDRLLVHDVFTDCVSILPTPNAPPSSVQVPTIVTDEEREEIRSPVTTPSPPTTAVSGNQQEETPSETFGEENEPSDSSLSSECPGCCSYPEPLICRGPNIFGTCLRNNGQTNGVMLADHRCDTESFQCVPCEIKSIEISPTNPPTVRPTDLPSLSGNTIIATQQPTELPEPPPPPPPSPTVSPVTDTSPPPPPSPIRFCRRPGCANANEAVSESKLSRLDGEEDEEGEFGFLLEEDIEEYESSSSYSPLSEEEENTETQRLQNDRDRLQRDFETTLLEAQVRGGGSRKRQKYLRRGNRDNDDLYFTSGRRRRRRRNRLSSSGVR